MKLLLNTQRDVFDQVNGKDVLFHTPPTFATQTPAEQAAGTNVSRILDGNSYRRLLDRYIDAGLTLPFMEGLSPPNTSNLHPHHL